MARDSQTDLFREACPRRASGLRFAVLMDDHAAIARYNAAGETRRGGFVAVGWPDLATDGENLARLVEGVLGARFDFARLAFGDDFEAEACGERLAEAWRTDALQPRYAPEGVFVRAAFTVQVAIEPEETEPDDPGPVETLVLEVELCVSFTHRHHTRPYVDFMGGNVRRVGDGAKRTLDPFASELTPADAVAWGLNGS